MIPTRAQIQEKINESKESDLPLDQFMSNWLDTLDLPKTITIANEVKDPKEMIMSDLDSYVA